VGELAQVEPESPATTSGGAAG